MPVFVLSCLAYVGVALSGSTLGLLWPSMRLSLHQPVGALGLVLFAGVLTSIVAGAVTGRLLPRTGAGPLVTGAASVIAAALAAEATAPAFWVIVAGSAVYGLGFGSLNTALNGYAAGSFSARDVNWMHAAYGVGATLGPLLVTAMLAAGLGWRPALGSMAGVVAAVAVVLLVTRHRWAKSPPRRPPAHHRRGLLAGAVLTAVESGIETAAGVWAYVFLTTGRGVAPVVAGVVVSAYWATMVVGRASLGVLAGRIGARRVLTWAIGTVPVGALLMAVPGPAFVAVAGLIVLGLATAPVFPLLTFTTGGATTAVGLQVAASSVGSAALPSAVGLLIGGVGASALGPSLLVLGVLMCVVYPLRR